MLHQSQFLIKTFLPLRAKKFSKLRPMQRLSRDVLSKTLKIFEADVKKLLIVGNDCEHRNSEKLKTFILRSDKMILFTTVKKNPNT